MIVSRTVFSSTPVNVSRNLSRGGIIEVYITLCNSSLMEEKLLKPSRAMVLRTVAELVAVALARSSTVRKAACW